jgi:hypothetical protein
LGEFTQRAPGLKTQPFFTDRVATACVAKGYELLLNPSTAPTCIPLWIKRSAVRP